MFLSFVRKEVVNSYHFARHSRRVCTTLPGSFVLRISYSFAHSAVVLTFISSFVFVHNSSLSSLKSSFLAHYLSYFSLPKTDTSTYDVSFSQTFFLLLQPTVLKRFSDRSDRFTCLNRLKPSRLALQTSFRLRGALSGKNDLELRGRRDACNDKQQSK